MGQMGQQQDFAKGIQMLRLAAEHADENAPQGAYVRHDVQFSIFNLHKADIYRFLACYKLENFLK